MPPDFPTVPYETVHGHLERKSLSRKPEWAHYSGAWGAVAYRFLSCADHDATFTASIRHFGITPVREERYRQERALFDFFVNGFSVIESFCFAIHALGAMFSSRPFPMKTATELRAVTPIKTADRFSTVFPGDGLTMHLSSLVRHPDFAAWKRIRTVLEHGLAVGGASPRVRGAASSKGLAIDATTTSRRRQWLASNVGALIVAAEPFVKSRFP